MSEEERIKLELEEKIKHLEEEIKKLEIENELMKSLLSVHPVYTYEIR